MANDYTRIVCNDDRDLTVFIDRTNAAASVWAEYNRRDGDEPAHISTVFQTADMPADDQEAAAKVNEWLEDQQ